MLSQTSEHALRALAAIARTADGKTVLARTLASSADVPLRYLSKILGNMTKAGILRASRGRKGGYRLARAADQIPLMDIVELFDGTKALSACLFGGGRECTDEYPCSGHEPYKRIREGYIEFLETTTVADIGRGNGEYESTHLHGQ